MSVAPMSRYVPKDDEKMNSVHKGLKALVKSIGACLYVDNPTK